jgi:hypothetical protein
MKKLKIEHLNGNTEDTLLKDIVNYNVDWDKVEIMMREETFCFAPYEELVDAHVFSDNEVTFTRTGFILMPIGDSPLKRIEKFN